MPITRGATLQIGTGGGLDREGSLIAHSATQMLAVWNTANTILRGRLLTVNLSTLGITGETDAEVFNDAAYRPMHVRLAQLSSARHIVGMTSTVSPFQIRAFTIDVSGVALTPNTVFTLTDQPNSSLCWIFDIDGTTAVMCYIRFNSPNNELRAIVLNIDAGGLVTEAAPATTIDSLPGTTNFSWWDVVRVGPNKFALLRSLNDNGTPSYQYQIIGFERTGTTFNVAVTPETVFSETSLQLDLLTGWSQADDRMISVVRRDAGVQNEYFLSTFSGVNPATTKQLTLGPPPAGIDPYSLITTNTQRVMHGANFTNDDHRTIEMEIPGDTSISHTAGNQVDEFSLSTTEGESHVRPMQTLDYGVAIHWNGANNPVAIAMRNTEQEPPPPSKSGQFALSVMPSREGEHVWMTGWFDGVLELRRWNTTDLSFDRIYELGAATFDDVANRVRGAWCFAASDDLVYVFGRMDSPGLLSGDQHIIALDETQPTPAFTAVVTGWGTDIAASFHAGFPSGSNRNFFAIRERSAAAPSLYHGTNDLATESVLPFAAATVFTHRSLTFNQTFQRIAIAATSRTAAPVVVRAVNPYTTWEDITEDYPLPANNRVLSYTVNNG